MDIIFDKPHALSLARTDEFSTRQLADTHPRQTVVITFTAEILLVHLPIPVKPGDRLIVQADIVGIDRFDVKELGE